MHICPYTQYFVMPFVKGDMESQRVQCNPLNYNQATTNLAFQSNETSKDVLSIMLNWLLIIVIQVHAKVHKNLFISTCSLQIDDKFVKTRLW